MRTDSVVKLPASDVKFPEKSRLERMNAYGLTKYASRAATRSLGLFIDTLPNSNNLEPPLDWNSGNAKKKTPD